MPQLGDGQRNKSFFQTIETLQNTMRYISEERQRKRELEAQKELGLLAAGQKQDSLETASINARANMINALQQSGVITEVNMDKIREILPEIQSLEMGISREQQKRKTQLLKGAQSLEKEKLKGTEARKTVEFKGGETRKTEAFKSEQRKEATREKLAFEAAKWGLEPSDLLGGKQAVKELGGETELRPEESFIIVPSKFLGLGKKDISMGDVIDLVGSEAITDEFREVVSNFNEALKARPKSKDKIIEKFISVYPKLAGLFGG